MANSIDRMSYHAMVERQERFDAIENTLGITNKIVVEWRDEKTSKRYCITSSGVVLVKKLNQDFLITFFMATVKQCERICLKSGKKQIPPKLLKKVEKNNLRHPELLTI